MVKSATRCQPEDRAAHISRSSFFRAIRACCRIYLPSQHLLVSVDASRREFADCGGLCTPSMPRRAPRVSRGLKPRRPEPTVTRLRASAKGRQHVPGLERLSPISEFLVSGAARVIPGRRIVLDQSTGIRCTLQDYQEAVFGERAPDLGSPVGYAEDNPLDSIGISTGPALKSRIRAADVCRSQCGHRMLHY